jgi:bifunctional DNase/RNase
MLRRMVIKALTMDSSTQTPVVVLKELDGERMLPIWLGFFEATILASELKDAKFSRPMTHDLLKNIIKLVNVEVRKIEIGRRINNICCAAIHITHNGREIDLDARPSDALILSLRFDAPIFVADEIIHKSRQIILGRESGDTSNPENKWKQVLEGLRPEDFGKYPM